ncbi:hypothetical protein BJ508DRAFT_308409 [Ascobolus immersus RN42]|uniref:Uncharacterized protein n=1 Tax=Ascobolus immersus RN42 TaxID=1160509 RepID=A0A3N4IC71_ASCIM|nr:hypothetical protein BJ508DRAFT_308409 [Ascobolus immersus RN42]
MPRASRILQKLKSFFRSFSFKSPAKSASSPLSVSFPESFISYGPRIYILAKEISVMLADIYHSYEYPDRKGCVADRLEGREKRKQAVSESEDAFNDWRKNEYIQSALEVLEDYGFSVEMLYLDLVELAKEVKRAKTDLVARENVKKLVGRVCVKHSASNLSACLAIVSIYKKVSPDDLYAEVENKTELRRAKAEEEMERNARQTILDAIRGGKVRAEIAELALATFNEIDMAGDTK